MSTIAVGVVGTEKVTWKSIRAYFKDTTYNYNLTFLCPQGVCDGHGDAQLQQKTLVANETPQ